MKSWCLNLVSPDQEEGETSLCKVRGIGVAVFVQASEQELLVRVREYLSNPEFKKHHDPAELNFVILEDVTRIFLVKNWKGNQGMVLGYLDPVEICLPHGIRWIQLS